VSVLLAATVGLSGCGTAINLVYAPCHGSRQAVYGGVETSVGFALAAVKQAADFDPLTSPFLLLGGVYFVAVDAPLPLAGDTVTLPIPIPASRNKERKHDIPVLEKIGGPAEPAPPPAEPAKD